MKGPSGLSSHNISAMRNGGVTGIIAVIENHTRLCKTVEIRGMNFAFPVKGDMVIAQSVNDQQNDIHAVLLFLVYYFSDL
jgi:hypothetical protein